MKPRPSLPIGRKVPSPGEPLPLPRPEAALGVGLRSQAHRARRTESRAHRVPGILPVLSRPGELPPPVLGMLGTVVSARSSASQGTVKAAGSDSTAGTRLASSRGCGEALGGGGFIPRTVRQASRLGPRRSRDPSSPGARDFSAPFPTPPRPAVGLRLPRRCCHLALGGVTERALCSPLPLPLPLRMEC